MVSSLFLQKKITASFENIARKIFYPLMLNTLYWLFHLKEHMLGQLSPCWLFRILYHIDLEWNLSIVFTFFKKTQARVEDFFRLTHYISVTMPEMRINDRCVILWTSISMWDFLFKNLILILEEVNGNAFYIVIR